MKLTEEQKSVITDILKFEKDIQTLGGYAGTGKAQPLDSLILTPSGFVQMGEIKVDSEVITPTGKIAKVSGVFPQGKKKIFRIWFSDGHSVECCDDHLWKVIDRRRLSNLKKYKTLEKVLPLSYIRDFLSRSDGKNRFYIPTCKPIEFQTSKIHAIDSYLLGVFLGDGSFTDDNFAIHNKDSEILDKCNEILKSWDCHLKLKSGSDITYDIKSNFGKTRNASSISLREELRKLDLWNCVCEDRFIPSIYLHSNIESRIQLLRGLMDTDGTVDKHTGMASFTTKSSRLARDICFLVESLGGICKIKNQEKTCLYKGKLNKFNSFFLNIGINDTPSIFNLSRKKQLAKKRTKYYTQRCIRNVEFIGLKEAQCIMVNDESHMYVTDHFVPTHNTTVIQHLHHFLKNWAVCAFTGKAANVLRRKGLEASTIHSLIYEPMKNPDGSLVVDKNGNPIFILAESLNCDGIIVDEASMVSKEIHADLISFGKPILFVGDHGQLEPVGSDFNIMQSPDFRLEQIHRNAGEIAHFAEHIRKGFRAAAFSAGKCIHFVNSSQAKSLYPKVDQIICAYNKTKVEINVSTRVQLWGESYIEKPIVGDKVMCLRNHKQAGLFNGMQGTIKYLHTKPSNKFIFTSEDKDYDVFFDPAQFNKERYEISTNRDDPHPFDYCYGITCHKAQGDEWDEGLVIEQKCNNWDHRRWAYTAASRFKKKLNWLCQ